MAFRAFKEAQKSTPHEGSGGATMSPSSRTEFEARHVDAALKLVQPTVNKGLTRRFEEFTKRYGVGG